MHASVDAADRSLVDLDDGRRHVAMLVEGQLHGDRARARGWTEAAPERAGVGRGTAYRYFPNQRALLAAAHPRATVPSMLPPDAPSDPTERLRMVVGGMTRMTAATEQALRTMLRLSLEDDAASRALPLRVGRRLVWGLQAWIAEVILLGGRDEAAPPPPPTGATLGVVRARVGNAVAGPTGPEG